MAFANSAFIFASFNPCIMDCFGSIIRSEGIPIFEVHHRQREY